MNTNSTKHDANAKVIVVPAPRILTQNCWDALKRQAEQGATIVISGVIDDDEHVLQVDRGKSFGWIAGKQPVSESESILIGARSLVVRYESEKMQRVEKAVVENRGPAQVIISKHGRGRFVWSPLPVEVSESIEATVAFYRFALGQARFSTMFRVVPDTPGILVVPSVFEKHALYTFVSETDRDVSLRLFHKEARSSTPVVIKANRTAFLLLDRKTGSVIGSTN